MKLYKRSIFNKIQAYLGDETILVIIGARQVGKTHILYHIKNYLEEENKKVLFYDLEFPELLNVLNIGVDSFLLDLSNKGYVKGEEIFVLIDEIQYLENPSSFLKIIADHYKNIHLIVSGSSTFDIKSKFRDSLVGRIIAFEVFPLSFKEFLIFKEAEYKKLNSLSHSGIIHTKLLYEEFIKYGGYPKITLEPSKEKKKQYLIQMIDTYIRKDIRDLAHITDISKFNSMLKILASQSGQLINMPSLSRETVISLPTLKKYLSILEETFIIKLVTPYSKSPSVEMSKNPKIFFLDSGLQSILWLYNFQDTVLGSVFETNIYGELIKKYGRFSVHFWRTKSHQEVDFIIEKDNMSILPVEVKFNFQQTNTSTLKLFQKKYHTQEGKVIALKGLKDINIGLYPWEI